jgi:uncharacterized Ntn-hydrolase superfamily protein
MLSDRAHAQADRPVCLNCDLKEMLMTFSLVARSGSLMAAATASYSLAVGNAVPALAPGLGAVLSQAYTNRTLRHHALDGLRAGRSAPDVLASLASRDDGWQQRQVAVLPAAGPGAAHTGASCTQWAGSLVSEDCVAAGNLLAGAKVLQAMEAAWCRDSGSAARTQADDVREFAWRVFSALRAGETAGGDARGKQSAALLICSNAEKDLSPPQLLVDLRVDDSSEPLDELQRLLGLACPES